MLSIHCLEVYTSVMWMSIRVQCPTSHSPHPHKQTNSNTRRLSCANWSTSSISLRCMHTQVKPWMVENWRTVCANAACIYLLTIYAGQQLMASRERFEMRPILTAWNFFLATFSIMGALRTLPEFLHVLSTQGIYHSLCISR